MKIPAIAALLVSLLALPGCMVATALVSDVVLGIDPIADLETATARMSKTEPPQADSRRKELLALAEQGDADAEFQLYRNTNEWNWLCRSANRGLESAQYRIAWYYRDGDKPVQADHVQAYKWFSLSKYELAADLKDDLAKEMTSAEIAEAERLIREWKPDPASCEVEGKAASK